SCARGRKAPLPGSGFAASALSSLELTRESVRLRRGKPNKKRPLEKTTRSEPAHERSRQRPPHRPLPAHHASGLLSRPHGRDCRFRALRAQVSTPARVPPRGGPGAAPPVPRRAPVWPRGARLGRGVRLFFGRLRRVSQEFSLHWRCSRLA